MRYRLRTLLIVLAVLPPLLAGGWIAGRWCIAKLRPVENPEVVQMGETLAEWEESRRRWEETTGLPFPEEPVIGYPYQPSEHQGVRP